METNVYQLVTDSPQAPTDYAAEMAVTKFNADVIPNSPFRRVTLRDDAPPAVLGTRPAGTYLTDAFTRTRTTVEEALDTLDNALTETGTWTGILDDSTAMSAAYTLSQIRGPDTFLYGLYYSCGLRTPQEFNDHVQAYGPDSDSDETIVVVPLVAEQ